MRPKTFPVSNYSGNNQQMLQDIRESLRNLPRPSDAAKADMGGAGKMLPEDPRQLGRSTRNTYQKALQEIRDSLIPFANEPGRTGEVNKHMLMGLVSAGFEEVRMRRVFILVSKHTHISILILPCDVA